MSYMYHNLLPTELSEDEIDNEKCDGTGFNRESTCCDKKSKECQGKGCFDYNAGIYVIICWYPVKST